VWFRWLSLHALAFPGPVLLGCRRLVEGSVLRDSVPVEVTRYIDFRVVDFRVV
jgi:hypothetical protein